MKVFELPDLGEGLQEAEVIAWHVGEGDNVVADQPLVSVETDKAVVEVPAPWPGRIAKLMASAGEIVAVGAGLVEYDEGEKIDAGAVVGEIRPKSGPVVEATAVEVERAGAGLKAPPAVRALARNLGVDLAMVTATGRGNVVTKADVERAAADIADAEPLEPLRGVRRAMARRMAQSNAEVAATTIMEDADVEDWGEGQDFSLRLIRAMVAGCEDAPTLNAWFDSNENGIRIHRKVDLGFAVNTDAGLFVPVLCDVAARSPEDLRQGLDRLRADVEARTVPAEELRGATITLTNAGPLLGRYTTPMVTPPQVAILGVCRARPEAVAHNGEVAVRRIMPLSLTFDHRAVSGAEASGFLAGVIEDLQKPE
ncbi:MAG: branched-chain alpha-keto acid dehydrogenase subunit E2 [Rhodospirillaceae bacterium]|nr:branched-chain alpha-keto acid dehydrogenase subunit E2 [Rhodospirillaceae bacterium]